MKRMKFIGLTLVFFLCLLGLTRMSQAFSFRSGDNVVAGSGEKIEHTLYAAGKTVDISSEVFGDVFCAGQSIHISGTIHGDVICAGQSVQVSGVVDGDIRLAGQSVSVGGQISGNATIGSQNFTLGSGASVGGDVSVGATDANFNGTVGRDIAASSANIVVSGSVGRNMKVAVDDISLRDGSKIKGAVEYTSRNKLNKSASAQVEGKISQSIPKTHKQPKRGAVFGFSFAWFIYWFFAMLAASMAIILLLPRYVHALTNRLVASPWKSLLTGFIASFTMPIAFLLLSFSLVGLPLAVLFALIWVAVSLLSGPIASYYLGRLVLRSQLYRPLLTMLVGAALLLILFFIPVVGFLAFLFAYWIGTGAILLGIITHISKPVYSEEQVPSSRTTVRPTRKK